MSEVAKAVKPLFDKFIDFFDIFDLSFFVSGATFVAAIAWAGLTPELAQLIGFEPLDSGDSLVTGEMPSIAAIMLILASYVSGMTCFALGRFVRKWAFWLKQLLAGAPRAKRSLLFERLEEHGMLELLPDGTGFCVSPHGQRVPWLARYFVNGGTDRESALYVRMWAEVRQRERFAPSFSLLRRYWVSAATLDGLFIAFCTWAVLLLLADHSLRGWVPTIATAIGAMFCLREAQRYNHYQRDELVATLLHAYDLPDEQLGNMMAGVPAPIESERAPAAKELEQVLAPAEVTAPPADG